MLESTDERLRSSTWSLRTCEHPFSREAVYCCNCPTVKCLPSKCEMPNLQSNVVRCGLFPPGTHSEGATRVGIQCHQHQRLQKLGPTQSLDCRKAENAPHICSPISGGGTWFALILWCKTHNRRKTPSVTMHSCRMAGFTKHTGHVSSRCKVPASHPRIPYTGLWHWEHCTHQYGTRAPAIFLGMAWHDRHMVVVMSRQVFYVS